MAQWFVEQRSGAVLGPLRPGELLDEVRTGRIQPDTRLRKDDSAWFPAGEVNGLFEAAQRKPTRHHCPFCNAVITKPPVGCHHCGMDVFKSVVREIDQPHNPPKTASPTPARRSINSWLKKKRKP